MAESYLNKTGLTKLIEIIKGLFDGKVDKSGGTITGDLVVEGTITGDLDGVANMASRIPYTTYTGTSTAIVVNNVEGFPEVLAAGASIRIGIRSATFNTACTLNVNGTGAKNIYFEGYDIGTFGILLIYNVYSFVYDGTYWRCMDANQLRLGTSTVGSTTQPIYLSGGKPTACSLKLSQVESISEMPTTNLSEGRQVVKDGIVYTYSGGAWVSQAEDLGGRDEVHAEEFVFQPTGGADLSIKDCFANINKIKGNTLVWNQLSNNQPSSQDAGLFFAKDDEDVIHINGTTTRSYFNFNGDFAEMIKNLTIGIYLLKVDVINNPDQINLRIHALNGKFVAITNVKDYITDYSYFCSVTSETIVKGYGFGMSSYGGVGVVFDDVQIRISFCNLTQMFGAGNEPSTVEEFEAMFPNAYYDYNEGELLSFEGDALKSVGFNAFDGEKAVVLKGQTYYLGGTYETLQFKADGESAVDVAVPSDKLYTPESNGELYATGTDICINLSHSGYRNGEYEPYKEFILPLDFIKTIKDAEGNVMFPEGLRSAGTACDEIVYDETIGKYKAIKRIGSVDMGTLTWSTQGGSSANRVLSTFGLVSVIKNYASSSVANVLVVGYSADTWNNIYVALTDKTIGSTNRVFGVQDVAYASSTTEEFKAAMSGKILQYELATPVEVILDDISLGYEANDFGTEEIVGNTTPIIPMRADIRYNFNAVDMIRGNYFSLQQQKERLNDQSNEIDQLQSQMEQLDETYIPLSQKGVANGVATLGADGKVPEAQLPEISGANNVLNFDNSDAFPTEGDKHTLYVASEERKVYAWTGSQYFAIGEYENATTTSPGLMSANDKAKLDGIESNANNYTLPTAGRNTLGGVKTTSSVTSASGYTACPIISGVPYYKEGSSAGDYIYTSISETNEVDFSVGNVIYMPIHNGNMALDLTFPHNGEYKLIIINDGSSVANISINNPNVAKMFVPQNISVDYGGSVVCLRFTYVTDEVLVVAQDYPLTAL